MKDEFKLLEGKFGHYFYDCKAKKDLALVDVLLNLNAGARAIHILNSLINKGEAPDYVSDISDCVRLLKMIKEKLCNDGSVILESNEVTLLNLILNRHS